MLSNRLRFIFQSFFWVHQIIYLSAKRRKFKPIYLILLLKTLLFRQNQSRSLVKTHPHPRTYQITKSVENHVYKYDAASCCHSQIFSRKVKMLPLNIFYVKPFGVLIRVVNYEKTRQKRWQSIIF